MSVDEMLRVCSRGRNMTLESIARSMSITKYEAVDLLHDACGEKVMAPVETHVGTCYCITWNGLERLGNRGKDNG